VPPQHLALAVTAQEQDPSSALHGFRRLLQWRKNVPLLLTGDIEFLAATASVLAFRRFDSQGALLAAFNLSADPASVSLPGLNVGRDIGGHGLPAGSWRRSPAPKRPWPCCISTPSRSSKVPTKSAARWPGRVRESARARS
jgi:hypothetical protein